MNADLHRRTLTVDDLPAVVDIVDACDFAVLGRSDYTPSELEVDLRDERIESIGWYDEAGALAAYGWVRRVAASEQVDLDVYVHPDRDRAIGLRVLEVLEQRGRELAAEAGHDHVVFDVGVYREDERSRWWFAERGFEIGTTFTRMRVDFDGPVDVPPLAPALTIRETDLSEEQLRIAHLLDEEAFTEHYMHVAVDFETFRKRFTEHGDGWASLWLAELDGTPVGLLVGTKQFLEDEDAGYVRTLGVVPAGRGRGVAKALLRAYFAQQQEQGRSGVLLHVDVANVTNALALYESVGMRPILVIDAWTKRDPVPFR
jgi:ribosomal protein S18 acetylase RimI-like enzyme